MDAFAGFAEFDVSLIQPNEEHNRMRHDHRHIGASCGIWCRLAGLARLCFFHKSHLPEHEDITLLLRLGRGRGLHLEAFHNTLHCPDLQLCFILCHITCRMPALPDATNAFLNRVIVNLLINTQTVSKHVSFIRHFTVARPVAMNDRPPPL